MVQPGSVRISTFVGRCIDLLFLHLQSLHLEVLLFESGEELFSPYRRYYICLMLLQQPTVLCGCLHFPTSDNEGGNYILFMLILILTSKKN